MGGSAWALQVLLVKEYSIILLFHSRFFEKLKNLIRIIVFYNISNIIINDRNEVIMLIS